MIKLRINKRIRIKPYMHIGVKLFFKQDNDKWICIKINDNEMELLAFVINSILNR